MRWDPLVGELHGDRQVLDEATQVVPGLRGIGGADPFVEFLAGQPARDHLLTEHPDEAFTILVRRTERPVIDHRTTTAAMGSAASP